MADQIRILDRLIQRKPFDLRALLRLATWGCAAAVALMLAVLSTGVGTKHQAFAPSTPQVPAATVQLTTRQIEADKATRQLSEAVSGLTADRDRLVARIASLERNLEDATGSIKQQAAVPPASAAALPAQASVHAPTVPAPTAGPAQSSASSQPSASAAGPASPRSLPGLAPAATATAPSPTPPPPRNQAQAEKTSPSPATASPAATPPTPPPAGAIAASPPAPASSPPPPSAAPTRVANLAEDPEGKSRIVDYGLDVGGATTFDGLRALWNSVRNSTADLLDDLHPMVAVRENKSRGIDLRLVVGPIANSEAATQMCATLLAARRFCQMTVFEGQPLPQASSVGEPGRAPLVPPARTSSQSKTVRPPAPRQ